MRRKDKLIIQRYLKANKYRTAWRKFVRIMACIVVFCTTYALILPAITLEQDYLCGLEEHIHGDSCYRPYTDLYIPCTEESLGVHSHSGGCYAEDGSLLCDYSDKLIHVHEDLC